MKSSLFLIAFLLITSTLLAQFSDTATLNQYLRDTIRDRRPDKVTAAQIQKGMLGISGVMSNSNFLNMSATNNTGNGAQHNNRGQSLFIDSITTLALNLTGSGGEVSSFLTFNEDGIYNNSNDFYYSLSSSMSANALNGFNFSTGDGVYFNMNSGLYVSGLDGLHFSSTDGSSFNLASAGLSINGVDMATIGGSGHNLTMINNSGLYYTNFDPGAMVAFTTGRVYINAGTFGDGESKLILDYDSTSLTHRQISINLTDSGIAMCDSALLDGVGMGKILTTDSTGMLLLRGMPDTLAVKAIAGIDTNPLDFIVNGSRRMRINNTGQVVINSNTTPSSLYKLYVDGWALVTGSLSVYNDIGTPALATQYIVNNSNSGNSIMHDGEQIYGLMSDGSSEHQRNSIQFGDYPDSDNRQFIISSGYSTDGGTSYPLRTSITLIPDSIVVNGKVRMPRLANSFDAIDHVLGTVNWDLSIGNNAILNIMDYETITLNMSGMANGQEGTLHVVCGSDVTFYFPANSKRIISDINDMGTAAIESTNIGKDNYGNPLAGEWLCHFIFNGTDFLWTIKRITTM